MALLGFNYSKPGPGVGKDNAQKTAFSRFFEIFSRKFWDLIKINMLYFICIIIFYIPLSFSLFGIFNEKNYTQEFTNLYTFIYLLVCALPIALTGPFTAGYTYILRNFVREDHAFIFAVMGLGRNILVTIVLLVLIYAHWVFALPSLLLIPFISLSFAGLLLNFAVWPMIKKHMIDPYQQSDMQNEINIKQSLFKDAGKEKLQK